ncbi:MAG TPA: hypothetical protein DCM08_14320 [Microscillaceae bacterium]|nr:hypothetical protein [Microscillaceae bacterium]
MNPFANLYPASLFLGGMVCLSSLLLGSCGKPSSKQTKQAVAKEEVAEVVKLSTQEFEFSGIQTAPLKPMVTSGHVVCTGKIDVPPQNIATVNPPAQGFIRAIYVVPGDRVQAGAVLAILQHPDLIKMQQEYIETKSQLLYFEKEYLRQQELLANNATAERTVEKSESEYKTLANRKAGLEAQLELLGIQPQTLTQQNLVKSLPILAPISGNVSQVKANLGKFVNLSDELLEIVNTDHLHAELQVFEKDIAFIEAKQKVTFTIAGKSEPVFEAYIKQIVEKVNPTTKTVMVHAHIEQTKNLLKTGMFVNATIHVGDRETLVVPETAVLREGDKTYAFVASGKLQYTKVPLELGNKEETWFEVRNSADFAAETQFVVKGAGYLQGYLDKKLGGSE